MKKLSVYHIHHVYKVVILNTHFQIRFDNLSLSICSLHYYSMYSKISFTNFHTKNARDNKKLNITLIESYTNHIVY